MGGNFGGKSVKLLYFFKNRLLYSKALIRHTKYSVMVYQNCKFHISNYSEYVLSSCLSIYFTLIAIVLKDYDYAFLYILLIFIYYYDGAVDMRICAPLTRSQCKVCDTQVTVKACGPLVQEYIR